MMQCFRPDVVNDAVYFTGFVALGVIGVYVWLRRQHRFFGKDHFLASLIAMTLWLVGGLMEMSQLSLGCKVFWASASWSAIVFLPTAWSFFIMEYCFPGMVDRFQRTKRALLWGGPVVALAITATNPLHQMFYGPATRLVDEAGRLSAVYDHGPLFFLLAAYLYLFLAYAIGQTFLGAIRAQDPFRRFFVALFVITVAPAAANIGYIVFGLTVFGFDPTPFAFSAVLTVLALMIVNNRVMDTDAIARNVLFYSVPDPVIVIGPEGRLLTVNPEARRLIGDMLPDGGLPAAAFTWLAPLIRAIISGTFVDTGIPLRVGERDFSLSVAPLPRPLGRNAPPMGWVLRMHDTTQRKQLQRALRAERDIQSTLTATSLSGIIALDETGAFVFANAEAERILGISLADGRSIRYDDPEWNIRLPDDSPLENRDRIFAGFLRKPTFLRDQRLSFTRRSDGERRILSLNATPLTVESRSRARFVLSVADITEQYRNEFRLKEAVIRAEAANRAKSQFLANMSHELRTPLNGVLGMAEVLATMVTDTEQQRMLATIRDSGELLLNILNDILDMAKIEAGKLSLETVPFDPMRLAERMDALFWRQADAKRLSFEVMVPGGALVPRLGDPLRVQQILHNLVNNAIKFTLAGEVRVYLSDEPDGTLLIEIRDTGIGMTEEQVARIFDEFEQADGSTTRRFGGTGLGMSIVRRLIDMMQGEIRIESQPNRGTRISLRLPLAPDVAP
ncbi:MAG: PAS domain S-box protein [Paracoccaceae bacterium]|nr:MAG: PAS domain S-box protein [Paracoccaceae bacterium]